MIDVVTDAIKVIEGEGRKLIEELRQCPNIDKRINKLVGLVPQIWLVDPMAPRKLLFYLQISCKDYGIDFGICKFYRIKEGRQYCAAGKKEVECFCAIPDTSCPLRQGMDG